MSRILTRSSSILIAAVMSAALTAGSLTLLLSEHAGAATTCPSGGSITLQNIPCAIQGAKAGPVVLAGTSGFQTVASLPLPAGKYVLSANLDVQLSGNVDFLPQSIDCRLVVGSDSDLATASFNNPNTSTIVALSTAHSFTSAGNAVVACDTAGLNNFSARRIRITAIRVGTLRKVSMS
jgi:hypothetical protein